MKIFLFSRRFLIPFFIIWALHVVYVEWEMWSLWKDDFQGKGLSTSIMYKFLWRQANGGIVALSFLAAFLVGISLCTHRFKRKDISKYNPFSYRNWLFALLVSLMGFLYISFYQPRNNEQSLKLLAAIVNARQGEKFIMEDNEYDHKNERMMTLPELLKAKDSLSVPGEKKEISPDFFYSVTTPLQKIRWEISYKFAFTLTIILFYIIGALMGIALRRTYGIFVLLLTYFIVFVGWFYCQRLFESLFKQNKIGIFLGAFGPVVLISFVAGVLYIVLRNQGVFRNKDEEMLAGLLTEESKTD